MSNRTAPRPGPHRLEVNNNGQYHPVLRFDVLNGPQAALVRRACEQLGSVDPQIAFRICDGHNTLLNYSAQFGWTEGR